MNLPHALTLLGVLCLIVYAIMCVISNMLLSVFDIEAATAAKDAGRITKGKRSRW